MFSTCSSQVFLYILARTTFKTISGMVTERESQKNYLKIYLSSNLDEISRLFIDKQVKQNLNSLSQHLLDSQDILFVLKMV